MGQVPWKTRHSSTVGNSDSHEDRPVPDAEPDPDRAAHLETLKAQIASGTYRISAERLASKLVRRIRWW